MSYDRAIVELRLRTAIPDEELDTKVGKILTPADLNVLLTGPARVRRPDGTLLAVYLPGAIDPKLSAAAYPALSELSRKTATVNRGLASGSLRVKSSNPRATRTDAKRVHSAIVGSFDRQGPRRYCRLTAWTGRETEKWATVQPLLRQISGLFQEHVPDRYRAQAARVAETDPYWVIPGTVFSTVTVNNTYPTGVHTDKGDLDEGFSTLTVIRRGIPFTGGILTFPRYRIGVDLQDGDLLLMDAHEWHGNTPLDPAPRYGLYGSREDLADDGSWLYERISVVSYYRTRIAECGGPADEADLARAYAEQRNSALRDGELAEETT